MKPVVRDQRSEISKNWNFAASEAIGQNHKHQKGNDQCQNAPSEISSATAFHGAGKCQLNAKIQMPNCKLTVNRYPLIGRRISSHKDHGGHGSA